MLYEDYETKISHENLSKVITALPSPVCLLGGWAVYYTVNTNYNVSNGKSYHGSKDIDLGFHLEDDATDESLSKSTLAAAIKSLKDIGFHSMGIRLFKDYHRETHHPLSEAKAKKIPSYNIFQLYVDLLVDNAPSNIKKVLGFMPFDEKRLTHVFDEKMFKMIDEFPIRVILPTPPVLLAMKIASLPARTKDHKKYKDIMDVYALIWHSGIPVKNLRLDVSKLVSNQDMSKMISSIGRSDYVEAAAALGVDDKKLEGVIKDFVRAPGTVKKREGKWILPTNMSYDRFIITVKSLLVSKADQKTVEVEELTKNIGVVIKTVRQCLSFLENVGVVEFSGRDQCSLTAIGMSYADAHMKENIDQIQRVTLEIINQSHLNDLANVIKINKNITRNDLYKRIKTFGKYPDGKGAGKMHPPVTAGATIVLRLFEDAGLLSKDALAPTTKSVDEDSSTIGKATTPHGNKPVSKGGRKQTRSDKTVIADADEVADQAVFVLKDVGEVKINNQETLKVAEMYMDMLRKRISQGSPQ